MKEFFFSNFDKLLLWVSWLISLSVMVVVIYRPPEQNATLMTVISGMVTGILTALLSTLDRVLAIPNAADLNRASGGI